MATPATPAPDPASTSFGWLQPLVKAIGDVPRNAQAGLLTGVLLVIVALAGIRELEDVAPGEIVFLGMICAAILLATLKKDAVLSVLMILTFAILGITVTKWQPATAVAAVPVDSVNLKPRLILGSVLDQNSRVGIKTVVVRAVNTSMMAVSDSSGDFDLSVPRVHVQGDSIQIQVQYAELDTTLWGRLKGDRLRVFIQRPGAAPAAIQPRTAALPPLMTVVPVPQARRTPLTVVLDSIRTIRGGSDDAAHWSFEVEVDDDEVMELERRAYDQRGESRLVYVGTEATARAAAPRSVLRVDGTRKKFLRSDKVSGTAFIDVDRIAPNTAVPAVVTVNGPGRTAKARSEDGEFRFYFTILRPHVQARKRD